MQSRSWLRNRTSLWRRVSTHRRVSQAACLVFLLGLHKPPARNAPSSVLPSLHELSAKSTGTFAGAAIDGMPTWRSEFRAAVAAPDNGELDESTVQGIAAGISFIKRLETAKRTKLGWGTYAATSHIAYTKDDPNPWGTCEGEVRASAEDILVRLWENEGDAWSYNRHVSVTTDARHGPHVASYLFEHRMVKLEPLRIRIPAMMWQALSPSQLAELIPAKVLIGASSSSDLPGRTSANHPSNTPSKGYIMVILPPSVITADAGAATFSATLLLDPIAPQRTRFTYVFKLELGAYMAGRRRFFSKRRIDTGTIAEGRCLVTHTMRHFQQRLPLAALDSDDARRLADALFAVRTGRSMQLPAVTERVSQRMDEYRALQELVRLHPSLPTLFAAVLRKKLRRPAPVTAHLAELTTDEASRIGDGLGMLIMTSPNAHVAVHEWLLQSEAMREMQEQHPCFAPMVERMAELLLTLVGWGVKTRVLMCTLLSYLDVISDGIVIRQYLADGEVTAAQASLGFLGANLLFQIVLCIAQNFRNPKVMALEIIYTLIFLKPMLEVLRILRGEQRKPYHTFSLVLENGYAKAIEVFAEAGPAAFLQMYMLLLVAHPTYLQYLSIVISIATAAFTIASIDFNVDTDPRHRAIEPRFYGVVPDKSGDRAKILVAMFLNSFTQMAVVVIGTAVLAHIDPNIAMGAWCGRVAMMYLVKLARRDFSYFQPIRGLPGVIIAAFVARPTTMFLGDVGLWAHGRHPDEMGCVLWWFGRVWPWLLLAAAIVLRATAPAQLAYTVLNTTMDVAKVLATNASATPASNRTKAILNASFSVAAGTSTLNASALAAHYAQSAAHYAQSALTEPLVLSAVAAALFVVWLLSLVAFFLLAKREYWPTFWSNETAAEYTKRVKWDGQPDERLRAVLLVKVHPSLLRRIAPEARIWIGKNWARWAKDKPDWFTDRWKRGLPDFVLTPLVRKQLGGENRRRSTLAEQLGVADKTHPRAAMAPINASAAAAAYLES
jgi:hypothetical protein